VPQEVRAQFSLSYRSADSGTQLFIGLIPEALMMSKIFTVESKVMHHEPRDAMASRTILSSCRGQSRRCTPASRDSCVSAAAAVVAANA